MKALLDTSILIDYLRGLKEAKNLIEKIRNKEIHCLVSTLTEAELFAGKECEKESKREEIKALILLCEKLHIDNEISQKAGEFKRKYNILLDDCIIAATAHIQNVRLWTKNIEEFKKIKEIVVEAPY